MLKVSKLTDYGIGLMASLARQESAKPVTARDLAAETGLPLPTVSKLLKTLSGADLLNSTRGAAGGYALARRPEDISLAEMFEALEGPMALTECSGTDGGGCEIESTCGLKPNWSWINQELLKTLRGISLRAMAGSVIHELAPLRPTPALRALRANDDVDAGDADLHNDEVAI